jgi:DegV family protein with EDD domain
MPHARIITDVTANLEPEVIERYDITVLPVDIHFGQEVLTIHSAKDGQRLIQRMAREMARKTGATIPARRFQEAYSRLQRDADEILVLVASRALSGAFDQARIAAQEFLGRCRIVVMETMTASWGLGLLVEAAARAAHSGAPLDEVVRCVRGILPHIYLTFLVERLDYLEAGGRVGAAQSLLGSMLHIRALLLMEDGEVIPLEKVRSREEAVEKLADFVAEFAHIERAVILKSEVESEIYGLIDELREEMHEAFPDLEFPSLEYDVILAAHLGPEALGIMVYEGE